MFYKTTIAFALAGFAWAAGDEPAGGVRGSSNENERKLTSYSTPSPPPSAIIYSDASFQGHSLSLTVGNYDHDFLAEKGLNDNVRSVVVPAGLTVVMCSDPGFRTECQSLTSPTGNVVVGDGVSSIKVVSGAVVPLPPTPVYYVPAPVPTITHSCLAKSLFYTSHKTLYFNDLYTPCNYDNVAKKLKPSLWSCAHSVDDELMFLTGTTTGSDCRAAINDMCDEATGKKGLSEIQDFSVVDHHFDRTFMNEFIAGGTFLNDGYGNFKSPAKTVGQCQAGVYGDAESVSAGKNVNSFDRASIPLKAPVDWVGQCKNNAVMCCWPRDRQCGDNNGNCNENGCTDSDPADNTNLCYMDATSKKYDHLGHSVRADVFLGESEGDLHCHGFAWSDDLNDISAKYAGSNFFFVSMYDHMYTRGYVGNLPSQPMCSCVEEMHPMSRSDCTELSINTGSKSHSLKFSWKGNRCSLTNNSPLAKNAGKLEFNACKGTKRTNDLYEHMHRLSKLGKIGKNKVENVKKTLFGWRNTNDNERENDCRDLLINYRS